MILAFFSICVVFVSLFSLYIGYEIIGYLFSGKLAEVCGKLFRRKTKTQDDFEVEAAISVAFDMYLNETVHDEESYIITIRRK